MHGKIRIKQMPLLFCKYLRNENSEAHEISCGGQLLSCELKFKLNGDPCINARARVVNTRMPVLSQVHACFIISARVYDFCTGICARIVMKFKFKLTR